MGDTQAEISVELQGDLDSLTCCRGSKVVVFGAAFPGKRSTTGPGRQVDKNAGCQT